eukprot:jgi/Botrbrau1/9322/Bobra.0086s0006.2
MYFIQKQLLPIGSLLLGWCDIGCVTQNGDPSRMQSGYACIGGQREELFLCWFGKVDSCKNSRRGSRGQKCCNSAVMGVNSGHQSCRKQECAQVSRPRGCYGKMKLTTLIAPRVVAATGIIRAVALILECDIHSS